MLYWGTAAADEGAAYGKGCIVPDMPATWARLRPTSRTTESQRTGRTAPAGAQAERSAAGRRGKQIAAEQQGSTRLSGARRSTRSTDAARDNRPTRTGRTGRTGASAAPAEKPQKKKSRYIPALDGLRAFAVLAVIAYHMGMLWAPSGLLGVTVFFVLSGYLITSLLLIEWDDTGTINLPQFWLRRVRRLFPAIVFVVLVAAALCVVFNHALLTKLREDMWAALLWVTNWWYILRDVSYFDALGAPSPLTHFWSLAIEEQFYVIWPVVLILAHKFGVQRAHMRNATLVLAIASAIEMALLFNPEADPSRVYYGTDTRAFSLLIGAWLAFVWPSAQLGATNAASLSRRVRLALDGVGAVAFIGLAVIIATVDGFSPFLYRGGILLASVLTAVIIAVIVHPASIIGRVLAAKPLVWIGVRSYGMYLWHYPLLLLIVPQNAAEPTPWWLLLIVLALVFGCSAFSYTFVENPIRRGAIGKFVKKVRSGEVSLRGWVQERTHAIGCAAGGVATLVAVIGLAVVPPTSALEGGDLLKDEGPQRSAALEQVAADNNGQQGEGSGENGDGQQVAAVEKPRFDVLMIGDSVSVRTIPYFEQAFPYGAIDAAVNRQLYVAQDVYDQYKAQDIVGGVVVFALGTNGVVTDDQIDEIMTDVGSDRQVFFVNTRSTQSWVDTTNAALAGATERYGNVHLIDWYGLSAAHGEWFDGDGTHLTEEGAQVYVNMVRDAIAPLLPEHGPDDPKPGEPAAEEPTDEGDGGEGSAAAGEDAGSENSGDASAEGGQQ